MDNAGVWVWHLVLTFKVIVRVSRDFYVTSNLDYKRLIVMIKKQIAGRHAKNNWTLIFLVLIVAVFVKSLVISGGYSAPLYLLLWYPVLIVSVFLGVKVLLDSVSSIKYEDKLLEIVIVAVGGGFLFSLSSFWGDEAAAIPLSLYQVFIYIVSFGILPFAAGPESFLRGIAWSLAVVVAILVYKQEKNALKVIMLALAVWLTASFIFLIPYLALIVTMVAHGVSIEITGVDMVKEFTRFSLFSYWNEGQLLRWFTGFGAQANNSMLLYGAAWTYFAGVTVWLFAKRNNLVAWFKGLGIYGFLGIFTTTLFGLVAGASHKDWIGMDVAAIVVFVLLFILAWIMWLRAKRDELFGGILFLFWFLGAGLLGWPVFVGGAVFMLVICLEDRFRGIAKYEWLLEGLMITVLMLMFIFFLSRGAVLDPVMLDIVGLGFVFALLAGWLNYAKMVNLSKLQVTASWLVAAILMFVLTRSMPAVMIFLPFAILLWFFWEKLKVITWKPGILVWLIAMTVLVLTIYLPRMVHPELIPR